MSKSFLVLAAVASAALSVPALAAPASTSVRTADLNLASPAGREALNRRIAFAAKRVCIVEGDRSLVARVNGNKCYEEAVNAARHKVASVSSGIALASN